MVDGVDDNANDDVDIDVVGNKVNDDVDAVKDEFDIDDDVVEIVVVRLLSCQTFIRGLHDV